MNPHPHRWQYALLAYAWRILWSSERASFGNGFLNLFGFMPATMNYDEHLEWLYDLQWHGMKLGLANTEALLAELGNPHDKLQIIHIAGTNGKGSVCAILTSVLVKAGYKVGTYTSPHLQDFTERIAINGSPVSEGDIVNSIKRIKPKICKPCGIFMA